MVRVADQDIHSKCKDDEEEEVHDRSGVGFAKAKLSISTRLTTEAQILGAYKDEGRAQAEQGGRFIHQRSDP